MVRKDREGSLESDTGLEGTGTSDSRDERGCGSRRTDLQATNGDEESMCIGNDQKDQVDQVQEYKTLVKAMQFTETKEREVQKQKQRFQQNFGGPNGAENHL